MDVSLGLGSCHPGTGTGENPNGEAFEMDKTMGR